MIETILNPKTRRWLYRISWAALVVLGIYGILTSEQLAAWAFLAAAVLGIADVHTDPTSPNGMPLPRRAIPPEGS